MSEPVPLPVLDEALRRTGLGAFAHEMRTPLTAMRMLVDLARKPADDSLEFDSELSQMLVQSLEELTRLADAIQDVSRIERGKDALATGPCALRDAVAAGTALIAPDIRIESGPLPDIAGPWDPRRLPRAIAGLARGANHTGDGSGTVTLIARLGTSTVDLFFTNGAPAEEARQPEADTGFAFFEAASYIRAMGGTVVYRRVRGGCCIEATLPLERGDAPGGG